MTPIKTRKVSPETRAKISASLKGRKRPPRSAEWCAKISAALKGRRNPHKGSSPSEETRAKMSAAHKGEKHHNFGKSLSPETRAKMSAALRGEKHPLWGKHRSPETCEKIAAANRGSKNPMKRPEVRAKVSAAMRGPNHPRWRGGVSRELYAWTFNEELKEEVRRRDGHKCQLCGVPQVECETALHVHHIDYDKKNSDPVNLVALCRSCHMRTNTNRSYWTAFFQGGRQ